MKGESVGCLVGELERNCDEGDNDGLCDGEKVGDFEGLTLGATDGRLLESNNEGDRDGRLQ